MSNKHLRLMKDGLIVRVYARILSDFDHVFKDHIAHSIDISHYMRSPEVAIDHESTEHVLLATDRDMARYEDILLAGKREMERRKQAQSDGEDLSPNIITGQTSPDGGEVYGIK